MEYNESEVASCIFCTENEKHGWSYQYGYDKSNRGDTNYCWAYKVPLMEEPFSSYFSLNAPNGCPNFHLKSSSY